MTRVEYAIQTYKNLTLEEVQEFQEALRLLPDSVNQYTEAIKKALGDLNEEELFLSVGEAAKLAGCSIHTIRKWDRQGYIERVNESGHPRYAYKDIKAFSEKRRKGQHFEKGLSIPAGKRNKKASHEGEAYNENIKK